MYAGHSPMSTRPQLVHLTTKLLRRPGMSASSSSFAPSSSSSSAFAVDVINLVDDDCIMPELPATPPSATSSILPDTTSAFGDSDPFHITLTSQHVFATYQLMRDYIEQYAAQCGFEVRYPSNKGTPDQTGHAGTARCWCYLAPPTVLKPEQQQQPSHPPQRVVIPRAANRSGNQVKCGCPWRINFSRRVSGEYSLTSTRHLQHAGHDCIAPDTLSVTIDSLLVVPDAVKQDVRMAITSGMHGIEPLRRFLATKHQLDLDRTVFNNLVQHSSLQPPPLDVSVPLFSSSVAAPAANLPARRARWGQIMGWCTTITSIAAENSELFSHISMKVEALCKEVERLASKPAAEREVRAGAAVHATSASPSPQSALHPSVAVEQMQMPQHRKRKRGNTSQKRQQSAVELASKGMRVHLPLTASQTM